MFHLRFLFAFISMLVFASQAPVNATTQGDVTELLEVVGDPYTARFGAGAQNVKQIRDLRYHDGMIFMGNGTTDNSIGGVDVWAYDPSAAQFVLDFERMPQELVEQFRLIDGALYVSNEDFMHTGANINFRRDGVWETLFIPQPFHLTPHSRDVYYKNNTFIVHDPNHGNVIIGLNDGATWRQASVQGGSNVVGSGAFVFLEVGGSVYAIGGDNSPVYRFVSGQSYDFVQVQPNQNAFPAGSTTSWFHNPNVEFLGDLFYLSRDFGSERLFRIRSLEPTVQVDPVIIPSYSDLPNARIRDIHIHDGTLRALVTIPITEGPNLYRFRCFVLESNDGVNWTERFNLISPQDRIAFTRFESIGDEFYFAPNNGFFNFGAGQPVYPTNAAGEWLYSTMGTLYRFSDSASGPLHLQTRSFARIRLDWTNNAGANPSGWEVQRLDSNGETWATITTLDAASVTYEDSGLAPETTFTYRVRAVFADAPPSAWSATRSATTGTPFRLGSIADATLQGGGTADTNYGAAMNLNVKQHGNRKAYLRFDIRDIYDDLQNATLQLSFHQLEWHSGDIAGGLNFRLYALNPGSTAGNGKLGEDWGEMGITWNNAPANNTGSGNLLNTGIGTENGGQAQNLGDFNAPGTTVQGDTVQFSNQALIDFLHAARAAGAEQVTFALTRMNGASGTNSTFRSRENANLDGRPILVFVPESLEPPAAPTGLSATPESAARVDLQWTLPDEALTSVEVERRIGSTGDWVALATLAAEATTFADLGTEALTTYHYRVRALNLAGASAYSTTASVTTPGAPAAYTFTPTAYWAFEETSGNIASDSAGGDYKATFNNTPTWTADPTRGNVVSLTGTTFGNIGNHDAFNGMDTMTVAFWVRPTNLNGLGGNSSNPRFILSKRPTSGAGDAIFSVFFWTDNKLYVDLNTQNDRFGSNFVFSNNTWYHVAVTYDGSLPGSERVRIYVNGELDRVGTETSAVLNTNTAPVLIGRADTNNSNYFNGQLDDLYFFRESFGPDTVRALMNPALTPAAGSPLTPIRATASAAQDGSPASAAIDNNLATRWAAEGLGQWLQLDLGSPIPVSAAQIAWSSGDTRRSFFKIETSPDGAAYTEVFNGESSGTTAGFETFAFTGGTTTARYVRVTGSGNSDNNWNSINEIRILAGSNQSFPVGSLAAWRDIHFTPAQQADNTISGPAATPAADGVPNLIKYHLGLDPWRPATPADLPRAELNPAGDVLTFVYRRNRYTVNHTSGTVQWSESLAPDTWSSAGITSEIVSQTATHEDVEAHAPLIDRPRLFMRLHVE